jgi:hypothetical protein
MRFKILSSLIVSAALLAGQGEAHADSTSYKVVSGKSGNSRCYWSGTVEVEVAYSLTNRETAQLTLMVSDQSLGNNMQSVDSAVVSRGKGYVILSFNAGGCLRGEMDVQLF